jgi:hypothetical protein
MNEYDASIFGSEIPIGFWNEKRAETLYEENVSMIIDGLPDSFTT